jgi:predicted nucleic acid-binding protein
LLKLYLDEVGSALVRERTRDARRLATSALAYVEARSALARRRRAGDIVPGEHRAIQRQLDADWGRLISLEVTDAVLKEATRVADRHVLRAYDAIHLGSAILLRASLGAAVVLGSWDDELDAAGRREGFDVIRAAAR